MATFSLFSTFSLLLLALAYSVQLPDIDRQGVVIKRCSINHVCFAIDQSGSIDNSEYAEERKFVIAIAEEISKLTKDVSYSAIAFSGTASPIQEPTQDLNGVFVPAIGGRRMFSGSTGIAAGLTSCLNFVARAPGNRLIVLVTDGQQNVGRAAPVADNIKRQEIALVTVGIGSGVNELFLRNLATEPEFYIPAKFPKLMERVNRVTRNTCKAVKEIATPTATPTASVTPSASPTPSPCPGDYVCFAIDRSGSVSNAEFNMEKDFVKEVATAITARGSRAMYTAHTFASDATPATTGFGLLSGFSSMVDSLRVTPGGASNLFRALRACYEDLVTRSGSRLLVLMTDGRDTGVPVARKTAQFLRDNRIGVVTVGIGADINAGELKRFASTRDSFTRATDFSDLSSVSKEVSEKTCVVALVQPTPSASDFCAEEEMKCTLAFRGRSGLTSYVLKRSRGILETKNVITKYGGVMPDSLETDVLSAEIVTATGTTPLAADLFKATGTDSPYRARMDISRDTDIDSLRGKCIRLQFPLKRPSGTVTQCAMFTTR